MRAALLDELRDARAAKRAVALITWLDGRDQQLVTLDAAPEPLRATVGEALRSDSAIVVEHGDAKVLVEPHNPPPRLIIVGAVHVAEPLATMATVAGLGVIIVDPRRAWATPARFPAQQLVIEWPDAAIASLAPDARTAIVTLTHDPKLDDPALEAALRSPAFYIGCLGSKKTHAARLERLGARGASGLDRLHGPVGLPLGAKSPAEIAVSILAQIIAALRKPS